MLSFDSFDSFNSADSFDRFDADDATSDDDSADECSSFAWLSGGGATRSNADRTSKSRRCFARHSLKSSTLHAIVRKRTLEGIIIRSASGGVVLRCNAGWNSELNSTSTPYIESQPVVSI